MEEFQLMVVVLPSVFLFFAYSLCCLPSRSLSYSKDHRKAPPRVRFQQFQHFLKVTHPPSHGDAPIPGNSVTSRCGAAQGLWKGRWKSSPQFNMGMVWKIAHTFVDFSRFPDDFTSIEAIHIPALMVIVPKDWRG